MDTGQPEKQGHRPSRPTAEWPGSKHYCTGLFGSASGYWGLLSCLNVVAELVYLTPLSWPGNTEIQVAGKQLFSIVVSVGGTAGKKLHSNTKNISFLARKPTQIWEVMLVKYKLCVTGTCFTMHLHRYFLYTRWKYVHINHRAVQLFTFVTCCLTANSCLDNFKILVNAGDQQHFLVQRPPQLTMLAISY